MTKILSLPRFASGEFDLAQNADWLDAIFFAAAPDAVTSIDMIGSIVASSDTVTVDSTLKLVPGMPVFCAVGIPAGTFVGSVPTSTQFTIVDDVGDPVNATVTSAVAALTFQPLPLDITGIRFKSMLRHRIGGVDVVLAVDTADGTMLNGGVSGILSFNVLQEAIAKIDPGKYYLDIVAEADGHIINMFPVTPAVVNVARGITNP